MKHIVKFSNCSNNWSNALPLGNGIMGAMAFFEDGVLYLPVNHYEVYYNRVYRDVFPEDATAHFNPPRATGEQVRKLYEDLADADQPVEGEPHEFYGRDRSLPEGAYGIHSFSGSYPSTGELRFTFDSLLEGGVSDLTLDVEQAKVVFTLEKNDASVCIEIITARQDCILISVNEHNPSKAESLIKAIELVHLVSRDAPTPEITFNAPDENTVAYRVHAFAQRSPKEEPNVFDFAAALRAKSASLKMSAEDRTATVTVTPSKSSYELIFGVFTDFRYETLPCLATMKAYEDTAALYDEHKKYWQEFYSRANISLPDKFLEKIWYVNQYALDCCSGRDGIMKHHACGLNGLWDIRHPNLWGSMWYWDVNIQAAFAGVFSSNRLELGKVFSDGLKRWEQYGERWATAMHGLPGIAIDCPYPMYHSVWPWCAAYLWHQYEYSLDEDYLRTEAYPLFLKLCDFSVNVFKWDDERGCYSIYPDVSPEQGRYSHNTVITVASVKYMLQFTLKAAEILGDTSPLLEKIKVLYENLPEYPTCEDTTYGRRLKDAEDAPENLFIRHPSMLMPIFPTGEIDIDSSEEQRQIISNSINYLEDNCEIGVFQCSWLSAASSRLGDGQRALRLLYERGIDHMLRSNGLTAEATERFMNHCLILRQPLYYPCMMEFTGEMLAAVNEMLLQSHNHVIRVFPAMPDGSLGYDRMVRKAQTKSTFCDRYTKYEAWKDVKFTNMLAKGAFEVSAELADGKVKWVEIHSRAGGKAKVTTPEGFDGYSVYCDGKVVAFDYSDGILSFDTEKGKRYLLKADPNVSATPIDDDVSGGIMMHTAYTKRRIFIGENASTACIKTFDDFIRSWYLGDSRIDNHTVYKFDLTENTKKNYSDYLPRQAFMSVPRGSGSLPFIPIGNIAFTDLLGYGFNSQEGTRMESVPDADMLFGDCVAGEEPNEFVLELPRGRYEVLIVSGSEEHDTVTKLESENGFRAGGALIPAGSYSAYVLPICAERDGKVRIRISSQDGYSWRVNTLFLNMVKGYGF